MDFKYSGSHRADRTSLLKQPKTLTELINIMQHVKGLSKSEKCLVSILIGCGCRIQEAVSVRQEDIKFFDYNNREIPYDSDKFILSFISKCIITLDNLKNKHNTSKNIPIIKSETFLPVVEAIYERVREQGFSPSAFVYPKSRQCAWWLIKRCGASADMGNDLFCHYYRHAFVSEHAGKGTPVPVIQQMAGWNSPSVFQKYSHLSTAIIEDQLRRAYGPALEKYDKTNRPLTENQLAAAFTAAAELKEIPIKTAKGQTSVASIFKSEDGQLFTQRMPRQIRALAKDIRQNNPEVAKYQQAKLQEAKAVIALKKQKPISSDKSVDYSTLVSVV